MRLKCGVKREEHVEGDVRSAFRLEILISDFDDDEDAGWGIGGSIISVRVMLATVVECIASKDEASACPMKPPAPVIRMLRFFGGGEDIFFL